MVTAAVELTESDRADLVTQWAPMALAVARRFTPQGQSVADSQQEALLALVQASHDYDPSRGCFDLFATVLVSQHLRRYHARLRTPAGWQRSRIPVEGFTVEQQDPTPLWLIEQGLRHLAPADRELVSRYYGVAGRERATSSQLGAELGIKARQVTRRISGLVAILRDSLASEE